MCFLYMLNSMYTRKNIKGNRVIRFSPEILVKSTFITEPLVSWQEYSASVCCQALLFYFTSSLWAKINASSCKNVRWRLKHKWARNSLLTSLELQKGVNKVVSKKNLWCETSKQIHWVEYSTYCSGKPNSWAPEFFSSHVCLVSCFCLDIYTYLHTSTYLPTHPPTDLPRLPTYHYQSFNHPVTQLSTNPFNPVHQSIHLSLYSTTDFSIHWSTYLLIDPSIGLFPLLSLCKTFCIGLPSPKIEEL
jgi:hypothetical protein